jgi:3,4-dihydroxy 2-butanone 4-phosphate synthase/GTP cyclohydrolase II
MQGFGLSVTSQLPIVMDPNPYNERYLRVKAERLGHTTANPAV